MTDKKKKTKNEKRPKLFRVMFRGADYRGTAEQFHAKVVAPDFSAALIRACSAMNLDPETLNAAAVTLISNETELADGKVFDFAKRSRGFGERGGWICSGTLPGKEPTGPRKTDLL
jgi:hypothetical protein